MRLAGSGLNNSSESVIDGRARGIGVALGNLAQFIISNPCLGCVLARLRSPGGVHKLTRPFQVAQCLGVLFGSVHGLGELNNYAILI